MHFQKIDDILTKPFSLWLISAIIAVGLWTYVIGGRHEGEISRNVECKVEYINVAPQLEVKNNTTKVYVEYAGNEKDIDALTPEQITCEADAKNYTAGNYRIPVNVVLPKGIRLIRIRPTYVDTRLIRNADRLVNVDLVLPKDLEEGLYLDSVEIIPGQVEIKGIESDLARIGKAKISPTIEDLKSGKELLLPPELESSEPFEEEVKVEPKQIKLKALLVSGNPRRMFPVKAHMSGSPDGDFAVLSTTIAPSEVLVEGPKAALDKLESIETGTFDISDIRESTSMVISIRPPANKSLNVLGEGTVRVTVNLQPISATKEITNVPVKIEGGGQIPWKAVPPTVTVTIEGLPSNINSPAAESIDVEAYVNALNLFSNQASIPVRSRINSNLFRVKSVNPYIISILNQPN